MDRARFSSGFLSTRVGRRTLGAFLLSSMLPVLVVAVVGVQYVRQTLREQAFARVERQVRSVSILLLAQLSGAADAFGRSTTRVPVSTPAPPFSAAQLRHLDDGKVLLEHRLDRVAESARETVLTRRMPDGELSQTVVPVDALWGALDELIEGEAIGFCVIEMGTGQMIRCSPQLASEDAGLLVTPSAEQRWEANGLVIARRDVFLGRELGSPSWRVVLAEPRARTLAPAAAFTGTILVLLSLAMVTAFALGHRQIRLNTGPLEALRDATRRVVGGDLQTPVRITSQDEYGELGSAFNTMTEALSAEFALRARLDNVDRAALEGRRVDAIAAAALSGYLAAPGCTHASLYLLEEGQTDVGVRWSVDRDEPRVRRAVTAPNLSERSALVDGPNEKVAPSPERKHRLLTSATTHAHEERVVVLPLRLDAERRGVVELEYTLDPETFDLHLAAAQRLTDRAALGLANVRLLERLDLLSSGTLRAFARAIDANSPWTAGHSERVTQVAMAIARELQLSDRELATLYRGALMHDIGKISVPAFILDKAGPLTDDERRTMQRHPEVGESIVAPLSVFADALPVIRSHHERIDGRGYPDRLAGDAIPWLARILAVADTFDALVSDRPYRAGLSRAKAARIIEEEAGKQLDARAVEAFLSLYATGALHDLARDWPIAGSTFNVSVAAESPAESVI